MAFFTLFENDIIRKKNSTFEVVADIGNQIFRLVLSKKRTNEVSVLVIKNFLGKTLR